MQSILLLCVLSVDFMPDSPDFSGDKLALLKQFKEHDTFAAQ